MMHQILAVVVICLTTGSVTDGSKTPFEVWLEGPGVRGPVYSSPNHSGVVFKYTPRTSTKEAKEQLKHRNEPERHFLEYAPNDEENELFPGQERKTIDVKEESPSDGIQLDNEYESDAEVAETKSYFYQPNHSVNHAVKVRKESPIKKTSKPMKKFPRSIQVRKTRSKRSTIEFAPKSVIHDDDPKMKIRGNNNKHHQHTQLNWKKSEPLVTKLTISTVPHKMHKAHSASEEWREDGNKREQVETELGDYHEVESTKSDYASYSSEELGEDTDAQYDSKHRSQKSKSKSKTKELKSYNKKYGSGGKKGRVMKQSALKSAWPHHKSYNSRISSSKVSPSASASAPSSGYCKLYGVYENAKGEIISATGGCTDEPLKYLHALLADGSAIVSIDGIAKEYKIGSKIPLDLDNVKERVWTVNGKLQYCSHFGLHEKLIRSRNLCLKPLEDDEFMQVYEYEIKGLHKMGKLVFKGKSTKRAKLPWNMYTPISSETRKLLQQSYYSLNFIL